MFGSQMRLFSIIGFCGKYYFPLPFYGDESAELNFSLSHTHSVEIAMKLFCGALLVSIMWSGLIEKFNSVDRGFVFYLFLPPCDKLILISIRKRVARFQYWKMPLPLSPFHIVLALLNFCQILLSTKSPLPIISFSARAIYLFS